MQVVRRYAERDRARDLGVVHVAFLCAATTTGFSPLASSFPNRDHRYVQVFVPSVRVCAYAFVCVLEYAYVHTHTPLDIRGNDCVYVCVYVCV